METIEILHVLREAKAQIIHLQELYNRAMYREKDISELQNPSVHRGCIKSP